MLSRSAPVLAAMGILLTGGGCGGKAYKRPYNEPTAATLLTHIEEIQRNAVSFRAESVMDYWVGQKRVRGTVMVMGRTGARMRFNALSPTGGNVAADLACDGVEYKYIDYGNDCQLTGPCTKTSIAHLLRVTLEPDDFLLLAVGSTPTIPDAEGTVTWDKKRGYEIIELATPDEQLRQTIVLDGREGHWDVLESTVRDAHGNIEWRLKNKEFKTVKDAEGKAFRVPGKTRFEQPKAKADLIVNWKDRTLNPELDPAKFDFEIPSGLPRC